MKLLNSFVIATVLLTGCLQKAYAQAIQNLTLVSTSNNKAVYGFDPLSDGETLNLALLPSGLSISAIATHTNSILFSLDGAKHLDGAGPLLSLCGDNDSTTYRPCSNLTVGSHILTAVPYSGQGGSGAKGSAYTLHFTVTDEISGNAVRTLYVVNQAAASRGSISVYNIDAGHKLLKTIPTVSDVGDVRGTVADAASARLYVAYRRASTGAGYIFALDVKTEKIVWNRAYTPGVDRLTIRPDGKVLYVPTGETLTCNYLNIVDAGTGGVIRTVSTNTSHLHDAQYPLSGLLFLTTHDNTKPYMWRINPSTYAITSSGPYEGDLGPFAIDSKSHYAVNNVYGLWGMQVTDLARNIIVTAAIPNHPETSPRLLHGIGWTPDQNEVWENSNNTDVYVWEMLNPMAPTLKQTLKLPSGSSNPHWLTFDLKGDYAYVSPSKNSSNPTQVFSVAGHKIVGQINSSEEIIEIDFDANRDITQTGDQYGIGRAP